MKPTEDLLDALSDSATASLTAHLDLTDPDLQDFKGVDLKPTIRTLQMCINKMKIFESNKK